MPKAKVTTNAINEYLQIIRSLGENADDVVKKAVYEGSAIIANQVSANISAIPIDESWGTESHPKNGITVVEKAGLQDSFGIADMQDDNGFINTLIGFQQPDYNANGKANIMIARATQSGTSFSRKIPFFANALRATRGQARERMVQVAEAEFKKLSKG